MLEYLPTFIPKMAHFCNLGYIHQNGFMASGLQDAQILPAFTKSPPATCRALRSGAGVILLPGPAALHHVFVLTDETDRWDAPGGAASLERPKNMGVSINVGHPHSWIVYFMENLN